MENKPKVQREKTNAKLTIPQKETIKSRITDLHLRGLNAFKIYEELEKNSTIKLSYTTVKKFVAEFNEEQNKRREELSAQVYTVAFTKVEYLERLAFEMLNKSEQDRLKTAIKTKSKGKGENEVIETEKLEEVLSSVGDIRILEFLRQLNRDRLEILRDSKFNAPEETTQQFIQQNNFYNYDVEYRVVELEPIKTK